MPAAPAIVPNAPPASQAVEGRLVRIVAQFRPPLRDRVSRLMLAATEAIHKLADIDLVRYESGDGQGGHTLALWEELAPVMGATVEHVNELIAHAHREFPPPAEKDVLEDLDDAFGPATAAKKSAPPEKPKGVDEEIASLVGAVTAGMRRDVTRLGERLRTPTVVSDTWMLVSDLLEFRGRVRAALGELIYQVCSFVAEVDRPDVIPGYAAELESALLLRQATTSFAFLFRGHAKRIAGAADERIVAALQDALKDLHAFSRTRALPALRTSDKRIFLEARVQLYGLARATPPRVREIRQAVENLARFLDSMSVLSRRENLRLHDRAQLAGVGRFLEQAQLAASANGLDEARAALSMAARAAAALYGRDAQLDAYLRTQRHFPLEWLTDVELAGELTRFGNLLAHIPAP